MTEKAAEKLIFKVRQENVSSLIQYGFVYEAMIDQYYLGSDCLFLSEIFYDEEEIVNIGSRRSDDHGYVSTSKSTKIKKATKRRMNFVKRKIGCRITCEFISNGV